MTAWPYTVHVVFRYILILRLWNAGISLHFYCAFSQYSTGIYQAFDRQTESWWVFNFVSLYHSRNFHARENDTVYSISIVSPTLCMSMCTWTLEKWGHCQTAWKQFMKKLTGRTSEWGRVYAAATGCPASCCGILTDSDERRCGLTVAWAASGSVPATSKHAKFTVI